MQYRLEQELVLVMDLIHHHWICPLVQVLSQRHAVHVYINIAPRLTAIIFLDLQKGNSQYA